MTDDPQNTAQEPQEGAQAAHTPDPAKAAAGRAGGLAAAAARRERKATLGGSLLWATPEQIHTSLAKVADRLAAGELTAKDADAYKKLASGMLAALKVSYTARLEEVEQQLKDQETTARDTGVRRRHR
jgi:hypothetical protein